MTISFLQVLRINVLYWRESVPGGYGADRFPVFLQENAVDNYAVYGLPSEEYPGLVKVRDTCHTVRCLLYYLRNTWPWSR